jgi:hypothetical protein
MTDQDRPKFAALLTAVAEVFGASLSTPRVELYWRALVDLGWSDVKAACESWTRQGERFPVPAQLRELVVGSTEDRAASAWAALFEAAKRIDAYRSLLLVDGAMVFAFETTFKSWPAFCALDLSPEMWAAKRKEFTAVYRAGVRRTCGPKVLTGHFDAGNGTLSVPGYVDQSHRVLTAAPFEALALVETGESMGASLVRAF